MTEKVYPYHTDLDVNVIYENPYNPNVQDSETFDLLVENIKEAGFIQPIVVIEEEDGRFEIMGGEHRWEAAKYLGMEKIPAVVVDPNKFTKDYRKFQTMRLNMITGKTDAKKFFTLYEEMLEKYPEDTLPVLFGFADEAEFQKLIDSVQSGLPEEMKDEFQKVRDEIKTIDDLALILNKLFAKYGDSLPYNYMFIDFGGKDSIWIRMNSKSFKGVKELAEFCRANSVTMDSVINHMFTDSVLSDDLSSNMDKFRKVEITEEGVDFLTEEALEL